MQLPQRSSSYSTPAIVPWKLRSKINSSKNQKHFYTIFIMQTIHNKFTLDSWFSRPASIHSYCP